MGFLDTSARIRAQVGASLIGLTQAYASRAAAVASLPVDAFFDSDETGSSRRYRRTAAAPGYVDVGATPQPTKATVGLGAYPDEPTEMPVSTEQAAAIEAVHGAVLGYAGRGIFPEAFGIAVGSGGDDSVAMAAAVAQAKATGLPLLLSRTYRTPSIAPQILNGAADLMVAAVPGTDPVVDAQSADGSARAAYLFALGTSGLRCKDITFRNFGEAVLVGSDGTDQSLAGNAWVGAVDQVSFIRCSFRGCARATLLLSAQLGVARLTLLGNAFDGRTIDGASVYAISGFHFDCSPILSAKVIDNTVAWIDTTRKGYGANGSPLRSGVGMGICLGFYAVATQARQDAQEGWTVAQNVVTDMHDARAVVNGVTPQLEAIRLIGVRGFKVQGNTIQRVRSENGVKDCSGIYVKGRWGVISGNTLLNACYGSEGAILVKGYTTDGIGPGGEQISNFADTYGYAVVVSENNLWTDYGDRTVAIGVQTGDVLVTKNRMQGFGGSSNLYTPIYTRQGKADRLHIVDNTVLDVAGNMGMRLTHAGDDTRVCRNVIRGISASAYGSSTARMYGIYLENVDTARPTQYPLSNLEVVGNRFSGFTAITSGPSGPMSPDRRMISLYMLAGPCAGARITDNVALDQMEYGLEVSGDAASGLAVVATDLVYTGNDFRRCTNPWRSTGSVTITGVTARDNLGYMSGSVTLTPGAIAAGASFDVDIPVPGCTYGDYAQVTVSNVLNQLAYETAGWVGTGVYRIRIRNNTAATVSIGTPRTFTAIGQKRAA